MNIKCLSLAEEPKRTVWQADQALRKQCAESNISYCAIESLIVAGSLKKSGMSCIFTSRSASSNMLREGYRPDFFNKKFCISYSNQPLESYLTKPPGE